eukprot:843128-Rhodomonas_salina.1
MPSSAVFLYRISRGERSRFGITIDNQGLTWSNGKHAIRNGALPLRQLSPSSTRQPRTNCLRT